VARIGKANEVKEKSGQGAANIRNAIKLTVKILLRYKIFLPRLFLFSPLRSGSMAKGFTAGGTK
jgi:hypothetical protein